MGIRPGAAQGIHVCVAMRPVEWAGSDAFEYPGSGYAVVRRGLGSEREKTVESSGGHRISDTFDNT